MADQAEQDIEFVPSDEIAEPELAGAEDDAVHLQEREEPRDLMTVEAEDFEVDQLDEAEAEELETEADEAAESERAEQVEEEEAAVAEEEVEEEHEDDLEEILRRHYGIVSAEPDEEPARRPTGAAEFVCRSCFLRKHASQLADPTRRICADCAANGA